jgi:hypothetical protein
MNTDLSPLSLTVPDVLQKAKALISNRDNWTQQCEARNKDLQPCPPNHPDAVAFCIIGAVHNVCGLDCDDPTESLPEHKVSRDAYDILQDAVIQITDGQREDYTVEQYNDTRTHSQVLEMLDTAILAAESSGEIK